MEKLYYFWDEDCIMWATICALDCYIVQDAKEKCVDATGGIWDYCSKIEYGIPEHILKFYNISESEEN